MDESKVVMKFFKSAVIFPEDSVVRLNPWQVVEHCTTALINKSESHYNSVVYFLSSEKCDI
jgi:hypothetical protein